MKTYEEYLALLDTLKDVARLPYTTVVENPPDQTVQYRRPFTREEFEKLQAQPLPLI